MASTTTCPECRRQLVSAGNAAWLLLEDHMRSEHGMLRVGTRSRTEWRPISPTSVLAQGRKRYTDIAGLLRAL